MEIIHVSELEVGQAFRWLDSNAVHEVKEFVGPDEVGGVRITTDDTSTYCLNADGETVEVQVGFVNRKSKRLRRKAARRDRFAAARGGALGAAS